ncbi:sporulation protein YqfD [Sporosarcina thermotolerans]|uniref:Sporulation protein YqfD n=1 Tax=Sporosarcina thermotolerans TaxID=633404 RepID=A0AAW9A7L5_9BACL|nr:sporulation protein YqfD [Sporosarcina thermotolerans]MDW0117387.1 sporulation protein YqfD [Sporosarcina thermotolerans]
MIHKRYEVILTGKTDPSRFLGFLARSGVKITGITESDDKIRFQTDKKGIQFIRNNRRRYRMKVSIKRPDEGSVEQRLFTSFRFLIACLIPLIASMFLWEIEIESDMPEVAERIEIKLDKASISKFRPLSTIPDEGEIRRALMLDDPSLSWVRFKRSGSTLTITPMLSPKLNDKVEKDGPPSDLIARTGGVITSFRLSRGERVAHVFQTVKKGDLLVTGTLVQGDKTTVVGAEGSVFADFWTEYTFKIPKTIDYQLLGEENVIVHWQSPIVWKKEGIPSFRSFIKTEHVREDRIEQFELTEDMGESIILPLIKHKILNDSQSNLIIKDENILHLTFGSDTVEGTILFLMNENIAVRRPIPKETETIE